MHPPIHDPDALTDIALNLLESQDKGFWMLVKGQSMLPIVQDGDRLQVQPLQDPPVRGEVLVFRRTNGLVAHRLLRLSQDSRGKRTCLTQGDHTLSPDPPISIDQVLGHASLLHRGPKVLHLDTPAWGRVGNVISVLQLAFPPAEKNAWVRRGFTACLDFSLRVYLAITGQ